MDDECKIVEPIGWEWAAFESGKQMSDWMPQKRWLESSGTADEEGWLAISRRNPEKYEVRLRPLCLLEDAEAEINRLTKCIEELEEALGDRRQALPSQWDETAPSREYVDMLKGEIEALHKKLKDIDRENGNLRLEVSTLRMKRML